ncbi:hypothetical protein [Parapedobacter indicus]|uniref:Uncharacterized protein n=1 Tax=Parapedobacter indicus TaxID=1477437 RepID=A0A1I3E399_9SPHI|nr:hypothetical protein [Parapedobacter indicus]PPL04950.1 hypothetical protein CLV26_101761 [Parapedobacter indicus]SFH93456.1 hypothetical protein SAMN05444682_101747 [Parapedobacter indicus]
MNDTVIIVGSGHDLALIQAIVDKFNRVAKLNITVEEFEGHLAKLTQPFSLKDIEITEMDAKIIRSERPFPNKEHRGKHRTHRNKWRR